MKKTLLVASLLGVAAIGSAQVTKVGAGYDLKVKHVAGQKIGYTTNIAITFPPAMAKQVPGGNQKIAARLAQRTLSVANGVATIEMTSTGGPGGNAKPQTVKMNNRGKIVGGVGQQFSFLSGYPAKPLKVGETWRAQSALPGLPGGQKADVVYTFRGVKAVGGKQVAQIDYTVASKGQMSVTGRGTTYLTASDGQILSSTLNGAIAVPGPGGKPMQIKMTVTMKRA